MENKRMKPTGKEMAFLEFKGSINNFDTEQEAVKFFNNFWDSIPEEDKAFWNEMAEMFTFE